MSLEREVLPDRSEARQEHQRTFRVAEAAHAALPFSRGLMTVFGSVVQPGAGFNEDVLDVCQLCDLGSRGGIATQLVGDNLAWHIGTRGEHALKKPLGCRLRDASAAGYRVRRRA